MNDRRTINHREIDLPMGCLLYTSKQMYGFLKGEVSSLVPYITNCVKDGSDYIITSQLRDKDTDEVKGTYEVTITASSFDGDDNCFAYSATAIRQIGETDSENQSTSVSYTHLDVYKRQRKHRPITALFL